MLLYHFGHPPQAQLVKSIRLCSIPQPVLLIWPKVNSGNYSIKTDYKGLQEKPTLAEDEIEASEEKKRFWKGIWKLKTPGKIKHFLWKSYTNSLPTRENLLKRTILHDPMCHLCAKEPENVLHALYSKVSTGRGTAKKKWSPPVLDSFKTNFDGAMFNESDDAGIGVVILNSAGKVMAALSEKIQEPPSVMTCELLAARRAVQFTIEMEFRLSSFEGDSETEINSLRKGGMKKPLVGHIIKDTVFG